LHRHSRQHRRGGAERIAAGKAFLVVVCTAGEGCRVGEFDQPIRSPAAQLCAARGAADVSRNGRARQAEPDRSATGGRSEIGASIINGARWNGHRQRSVAAESLGAVRPNATAVAAIVFVDAVGIANF
jgi:hypothetical protein